MFKLLKRSISSAELVTSQLLTEDTFYPAFLKDLNNCQHEALIESPFITNRRLLMMLPTLEKLKARKVRITINTRDPNECEDGYWQGEAHRAIATLQHAGIHVIFTVGHHRKLAILDRHILYEGSLNIFSQNRSAEIMRRVESTQLAWQMARFIGIDKFLY